MGGRSASLSAITKKGEKKKRNKLYQQKGPQKRAIFSAASAQARKVKKGRKEAAANLTPYFIISERGEKESSFRLLRGEDHGTVS